MSRQQFSSFDDFYPFYLQEHRHRLCRRLHFIGLSLALISVLLAVILSKPAWLFVVPVIGYGFAWAGHFFFERNRPATFKHPLYSLFGDFKMYAQMLKGELSF